MRIDPPSCRPGTDRVHCLEGRRRRRSRTECSPVICAQDRLQGGRTRGREWGVQNEPTFATASQEDAGVRYGCVIRAARCIARVEYESSNAGDGTSRYDSRVHVPGAVSTGLGRIRSGMYTLCMQSPTSSTCTKRSNGGWRAARECGTAGRKPPARARLLVQSRRLCEAGPVVNSSRNQSRFA